MKRILMATVIALCLSCDTPPNDGELNQADLIANPRPVPGGGGIIPDTTHCTIEVRQCYAWCDWTYNVWCDSCGYWCRENCYREFLLCRLSP